MRICACNVGRANTYTCSHVALSIEAALGASPQMPHHNPTEVGAGDLLERRR
eukprot:COSAG02_NODE_31015_length_540_cov_18.997732_1_plen_51_part_01